jgi:hypothetical protein
MTITCFILYEIDPFQRQASALSARGIRATGHPTPRLSSAAGRAASP